MIQKGLRFRIHYHQFAMFSTEESLLHGMVQECNQRIEIATDVENAARFVLDSQLGPGRCLEELLEGAEPSGEHDEAIRRFRHGCLALMHRLGDVQPTQVLMGDLLLLECPSDHTVRSATRCHRGVCHDPHQANVTAPVDEGDLPFGEQPPQCRGSLSKTRITSRTRSAIDAYGSDGCHARTIGHVGSPSGHVPALPGTVGPSASRQDRMSGKIAA